MKAVFLKPDGTEFPNAIMQPLLDTIYPALGQKAEEIIVRANLNNAADISVSWRRGPKSLLLGVAKDFHPFIASSRLRILAGMSIVHDLTQQGSLRLRIGKEDVNVLMRVFIDDNYEVVVLRPRW